MNQRLIVAACGSRAPGVATMLLCLSLGGVAQAEVRYVDDSAFGAGTGTSWCDAFTNLQDALSAAASAGGDITELRVAQGVYKPDVGVGQVALSRASTFRLQSGLALRGGYAGCGAPNADARDVEVYQTVLTGDLAGNDMGNVNEHSVTRDENAYHVVTGSGTDATAILDGFEITAGQASVHGTSDADGGGLYNDGGSPTISNCTFTNNLAQRNGGAILNLQSSSPTITNCRVVGNSGNYGGGICNKTQSNAIITNCEISGNHSGYPGAGVYNDSSSPQLIGCTIEENESYYSGGGVANYNQSAAVLTACVLLRNKTSNGAGGGVANDNSNPTLTECLFEANTALVSGGGLYNTGGVPKVYHATFRANHSNYGGGVANVTSSSLLHDCLFDGNTANFDGAGLYNLGAGTVTIRNTTVVNNLAGRFGGGVFNSGHNPVLANVILWNNSDNGGSGELAQLRGGAPVVDHSCVEGWTGALGGVGNHGLDPRFTSGPMGCFYLSQQESSASVQSPCVDAGNGQSAALALDVMTTRSDSIVDLNVVDVGYHYAVVDAVCGPGNFTCWDRINLRDVADIQRCFGGAPSTSGALCCEQFDVDGAPGLTLDDFALLAQAVTNP